MKPRRGRFLENDGVYTNSALRAVTGPGDMAAYGTRGRGAMIPDRPPRADFFVICDVFDAAPKDDLGTMEQSDLFALHPP